MLMVKKFKQHTYGINKQIYNGTLTGFFFWKTKKNNVKGIVEEISEQVSQSNFEKKLNEKNQVFPEEFQRKIRISNAIAAGISHVIAEVIEKDI